MSLLVNHLFIFSVLAETSGPEDTAENEQNAPVGESQGEPLQEESQDEYPEESLGPAKAP